MCADMILTDIGACHGNHFVRKSIDRRPNHRTPTRACAIGRVRDRRSRFDNGVSGLSTRLVERKEGRRLYYKLRAGDVLVVRWVDRLGRNYEDVCDTIREFMRRAS